MIQVNHVTPSDFLFFFFFSFAAEKLGLPGLNAYLDSIGTSFRHGANFAIGGSTIQAVDGKMFEARFSPISLDTQIQQFLQLKARTTELLSQG